MPHPAVPAQPGTTTRPDDTDAAPLAVVLTCSTCDTTYEPTVEDFAAGRTGCPDCGGWTYTASLAAPATGGAR